MKESPAQHKEQPQQIYNIVEEVDEAPLNENSTASGSSAVVAAQKRLYSHNLRSPKRVSKKKKSSKGGINLGHWTSEENQKFEEALKCYGSNWEKVSSYIQTRTASQVRSHNQKVKTFKLKSGLYEHDDLMYSYLKRQSTSMLDKVHEQPKNVEEVKIEPKLKETLKELLEPFAVDGVILMDKEMMMYAVNQMTENSSQYQERSHGETNAPQIIPLSLPD